MGLGITNFSRFITELNQRTADDDAEGLARWAVDDLSRTLGFDAAWYGWANLRPEGVEVYANATLNLPEDYFDTWKAMSHEDLLAAEMMENPGRTALYERSQKRQTDGMMTLADRYGLTRISTAMNGRYGAYASFYLSSYRLGRMARHWSDDERDFLQCAVDQISAAMKLTASEPGRSVTPGTVTILSSENGMSLLGIQAMREQFGELWPRWTGAHLPEQLVRLIGIPGTHILPDRDLVVQVENTPRFQGMGLRRLTLRRLTKLDLLTSREREVAHQLSRGQSSKEVALSLGIAPATVRNQTQAIYQKLQIDNRAELAMVMRGK